MTQKGILRIPDAVRTSFKPIMQALGAARAELMSSEEVAAVRPGYRFPGEGEPVPAVIVAVVPGTPRHAIDVAFLAQQYRVPFSVVDATPEEQLAALGRFDPVITFGVDLQQFSPFERLLSDEEQPLEFAPPRMGCYLSLDPPALPLVDEFMDVTICVSPDVGWGELESFLACTRQRLTVAIYQFTAPHIFRAVHDVLAPPDRTLSLVLHPSPEPPPKFGVKAQDMREEDVIAELAGTMGDRFSVSWATVVSKQRPAGLWASAYHAKVAVRDGETFWLSSGNWQSSNQPPFHPFAEDADCLPLDYQQQYNREYHAIITNERLATVFESCIDRDAELIADAGTIEPGPPNDVFVAAVAPQEPLQFDEPQQLFPPLRLSRRVTVQPLLTPDNYVEHTLALIRSATASVWFQNQYINFRNTGEDFVEFQLLVEALREKIDAGLDVRIICRDYMKQESVDILVALGFPRDVIRFQPCCHNKTIIVDRIVALLGSHNWSNEGVSTNRDASLIFFDEEIADYLAAIYEYDWEHLARTTLKQDLPRLAPPDEPAPQGYVRVPYATVYAD